ncbi:MAG: hypothetical protein R8N23_19030 [Reichenbachiella sp.]|uniref:hypothetical protein n=1 Tax=Reichenbachiella sp. TaxID=2184521 RepID=UPI002966CEDC|nr:hypothetical protein [Reichenbachiella sp.]MDW3211973.1 hypothetical protein [Reichenbachiella sp.]
MKDLDIKDIWKQGDAKNVKAFSEPQIEEMIRKGSDSLVYRFIKTLSFELWINLVVLTSIGLGMIFSDQWTIGVGLLILDLLFYFYYRNLIDSIKKEEIDSSVLAYLYTIQKMVKRFILHYKIASIVLVPLMMGVVLYLDGDDFYVKFSTNPESFIIGMACGLLVAIPITFYMIHLMYGKKAKKLAHMICSLEKEES